MHKGEHQGLIQYGAFGTSANTKKTSLLLQSCLYTGAGINHFVHPEFYHRIIPPYLNNYSLLNYLSGIIEIILGVLLLFTSTRKFAAYAIIAMLVAFIPAHIFMIEITRCPDNVFCWKLLSAIIRLVPGQPLLIYWAWKSR